MVHVTAPIQVYTNKKHIINLNKYRNWHYRVSNQIKKQYCEELYEQLYKLKLTTPIDLIFQLYKGSNRKIDKANIYSIHEKFFCDALVNYGCIEDDNDDYIYEVKHNAAIYDKENPRMDITIIELNKYL